MDSSNSGMDFSATTYSPITFKQCITELKRQALERLLSAVYKREVSINLLLVEGGASPAVLEALRYRNIGSVAEHLIKEVKELICQSEGGSRRYQIIERYYGLDGNMPARLSAMANKHGVSRERIRQIKERSLTTLRYKKSSIEKLLLDLSMRLLTKRTHGINTSASKCVSEIDGFKLLDHRQLLFLHEASVPWTEEQAKVLFDLSWAKRAKITGCAGSGKTWLAMVAARRLAASGHRTLLTCFNRAMADTLASLLQGQENLVVLSFHALCLRVGKQAGITTPGGWNNRAWIEKFPDVLRKAMLRNPDLRFDSIIVDDAQDFRENWWRSLETCLSEPDSGRLYYFVDDNILSNTEEDKLPEVDHSAHLGINLRSPALISPILSSSYVAKNSMRFTRSSAAPVEFYRCDTEDDMSQTLVHVFTDLVDKGRFIATDVAILTPRLPRFSSALKARLKGTTRIVRRQSDVVNHAILCRSHSFKGLERRVAIIIDLDEKFASLSDDEIKSFVYMTFTRFVDKLVILGSLEAWRRIEGLASPPVIESLMPQPSNWIEKAMERF